VLIRCQSYRGGYACPLGEIAVTGGDGMGSSTQVSVVRRAWPATTSCCARQLGHVWHGSALPQSCSATELQSGATLLQSFGGVWQDRCPQLQKIDF
jgi:hypothetical protein